MSISPLLQATIIQNEEIQPVIWCQYKVSKGKKAARLKIEEAPSFLHIKIQKISDQKIAFAEKKPALKLLEKFFWIPIKIEHRITKKQEWVLLNRGSLWKRWNFFLEKKVLNKECWIKKLEELKKEQTLFQAIQECFKRFLKDSKNSQFFEKEISAEIFSPFDNLDKSLENRIEKKISRNLICFFYSFGKALSRFLPEEKRLGSMQIICQNFIDFTETFIWIRKK